jgi:hypothetical protein
MQFIILRLLLWIQLILSFLLLICAIGTRKISSWIHVLIIWLIFNQQLQLIYQIIFQKLQLLFLFWAQFSLRPSLLSYSFKLFRVYLTAIIAAQTKIILHDLLKCGSLQIFYFNIPILTLLLNKLRNKFGEKWRYFKQLIFIVKPIDKYKFEITTHIKYSNNWKTKKTKDN